MIGVSLPFGANANGQTLSKEHKEFHAPDLNQGWRAVAGYPDGVDEKILSGHLMKQPKEEASRACCALNRACFPRRQRPTLLEEVYVLSGDFIVGNNKDGKGGKPSCQTPTLAVLRESPAAHLSQRQDVFSSKSVSSTLCDFAHLRDRLGAPKAFGS